MFVGSISFPPTVFVGRFVRSPRHRRRSPRTDRNEVTTSRRTTQPTNPANQRPRTSAYVCLWLLFVWLGRLFVCWLVGWLVVCFVWWLGACGWLLRWVGGLVGWLQRQRDGNCTAVTINIVPISIVNTMKYNQDIHKYWHKTKYARCNPKGVTTNTPKTRLNHNRQNN